MRYKTSEIFIPGGMPSYTYVSRTEKRLEDRLRKAYDNLCKLIAVTGATKSGKTVLTSRIFPKAESVWVDGGIVRNEDDFWNTILSGIDGYTSISKAKGSGSEVSLLGKIRAKLQALFWSGEGEIGGTIKLSNNETVSLSRNVSPRAAAISQLRFKKIPLVIDDFHYLDRSFQGNIIRALKPVIFEGLPVILIAIPHRRYDAIKVEREITGRLESIRIPPWEIEELKEIPNEGFPLLNLKVDDNIINQFAIEAFGSPHLMQEFCRALAADRDIKETSNRTMVIDSLNTALFQNVAKDTGKIIFDKLAKGPRQRSDRLQRTLKNHQKVDIYRVTLYALAELRPGMETIEYESVRAKIKDILLDNIPQAHEVTRVLEKMANIASLDESSTPVIDWEKDEQKLHITDPFFAFYLKWGVDINKII